LIFNRFKASTTGSWVTLAPRWDGPAKRRNGPAKRRTWRRGSGLETLADAVNRIKYPGLDLSSVFWTVPAAEASKQWSLRARITPCASPDGLRPEHESHQTPRTYFHGADRPIERSLHDKGARLLPADA
jgi:hypothetical protein